MADDVQPIPPGTHTVTPHLVVAGGGDAIDFYERAFGAVELFRSMAPDGQKLMHGAIRIGDSMVMLADEFPEMGQKGPHSIGGTPVWIQLYVEDVDAVFDQAVAAGASVDMPVADMFWGDRYGRLTDPFGHGWAIATHIKDVSPKEMEEAAKAMFAAGAPG